MKPILQALLLADHVYQDVNTGKMIIAGTFNRIMLVERDNTQNEGTPKKTETKIPAEAVQQAGNPYAYFSVTEIHREIDLELCYVNLKTQEVIFRTLPITVKAENPLDVREVILPVPKLPTVEGDYALEILWQNELLGSHRVSVHKMQKVE